LGDFALYTCFAGVVILIEPNFDLSANTNYYVVMVVADTIYR